MWQCHSQTSLRTTSRTPRTGFTAGSHFLVVVEVADILEHVPEQEPYTRLKAILKRTGRSDEELLRELFTHVTRGDRTPSQLLRFMRSRLGKHSMAESILRELWMDKLPTTITQILAPIADHTPLDQLANSADRIATKLDQGVCAVQRPDDTPAKETDLEKAVADLQHQLQDIRMLLSRTSRGPMPATGGWRRRARSTSRGRRVDPELCCRRVGAAEPPGKNIRSRLFYVWDRRNNIKFLVDTGAAISVIPPKEQQDRKATLYKLQAANGSTIETYGAKTLTLNIGMRRDFTWTFTQADVKTPILGADFLAHYDLAVHMNTRTLSDNTTNIAVKGTLSRHNTTGISVTTCHGREYIEILNRYSDLIQPLAATSSPLSPTLTTRSSSSQGQQTSAAARASREVRPPHQQQPRPAAARASRAVRPPHQQQPRPADISSSLSSDYQAAILRDTPPKDELTTPQHCPRRSSLSASADAPFTQVQTSRDRLDLGHPCFHSAYLQAVALKPDNAPPRLHDRTTTNDYLYIFVPDLFNKIWLKLLHPRFCCPCFDRIILYYFSVCGVNSQPA
ncbi:unnamed protein product [Acanthosepion pharaonis]|uniref:Peptidase A2 domain-containing protein n=1 Tax=Acanthosepion pharaonis TaxID=158019 RepID=A0A812C905_ACAPH|nr:unnamed protein product [Sepia pharaonis]